MEKTFGKIQDAFEKKQFPNFVIQGTKLVFQSDEKGDNSGEYKVEANKSNERISVKKSFESAPKKEEGA